MSSWLNRIFLKLWNEILCWYLAFCFFSYNVYLVLTSIKAYRFIDNVVSFNIKNASRFRMLSVFS